MTSLPRSLTVRPTLLWFSDTGAGRQGWGAGWSPCNPRGNDQWHAIPQQNMKSIYKKGWKEDSEKCRPVSLTSETGKALEQIMLSIMTQPVRGWGPVRGSLWKAALAWQTWSPSVTGLPVCEWEKGCPCPAGLSKKHLTIVSHINLPEKLFVHGLDGWTLNNWLCLGPEGGGEWRQI